MKISQRNQGSVLLARTGKTQVQIAARVDCGQTVVGYWLSGERVPGAGNRAVLRRLYGIPIDAWDLAIPRAAKKAAEKKAPELAITPKLSVVDVPSVALRLQTKVQDKLETIDQDKRLSPSEWFKCASQAATTLIALGKMTGQTLDVNEAKILRLPAFNRIQETILAALVKHPEAAREVGEALLRLGGEK